MSSELSILKSYKANEWMYVHQNGALHVTDGYWDKFMVCILDIFSGFSLHQRTHNKVMDLIQKAYHEDVSFVEFHLYATRQINHVTQLLEYSEQLKKISSVWNRHLITNIELQNTGTSNIQYFHPTFFDFAYKQAQPVLNVLPQRYLNQERIENVYNKLEKELKIFRALPSMEGWVNVATALMALNHALLDLSPQLSDGNSHYGLLPFYYSMSPWTIQPCSQFLSTAKQFPLPSDLTYHFSEKKISWLQIKLDDNAVKKCLEKGIEPDNLATLHAAQIQSFVRDQLPYQRTPVTIEFPRFHSAENQRLKHLYPSFLNALKDKTIRMMEEMPECFINRFSLYREAIASERTDQNPAHALSCITGEGLQSISIPQSSLRNGFLFPQFRLRESVQVTIDRLQKEGHIPKDAEATLQRLSNNLQLMLFKSPTHILKIGELRKDIEKRELFRKEFPILHRFLSNDPLPRPLFTHQVCCELLILETGENYTLSFQGHILSGHKEILFAAFPYLETLESFPGRNTSSSLFDFSSVFSDKQTTPLDPWILKAIKTYAYTQENPNLPVDASPDALAAYQTYLECIDYLNPGQLITS